MATQSGTNKSVKNETKVRLQRLSLAALVLVVLVGVSMTGSAAGQQAVSSCADDINTAGQYELTGDITDSTADACIEITADNVVLDGQGHKVDGVNETQGSIGIGVAGKNVTVKNFGNVTGWEDGIRILSLPPSVISFNNTLADNVANNNGDRGIWLDGADDTNLMGNTANNNGNTGIDLSSDSNDLTDNTANNNGDTGISLFRSSRNNLTGNTANNNGEFGISLEGDSDFNDLIDNEARDNSLNAEGSSAGILLASDSPGPDNNTLVGNTATGDQRWGIYLVGASDNNLTDNTANRNNQTGIYLLGSSDNELIDNVANKNGKGFEGGVPTLETSEVGGIYGIWLGESSNNNTLTRNEAFDNGPRNFFEGPPENGLLSEGDEVEANEVPISGPDSAGIYLSGDERRPIINNTLDDNDVKDTDSIGSVGGNQLYGIWLERAAENDLIENTASRNFQYGIWLTQRSFNNTLTDNIAEDNGRTIIGSISTSEEHGGYESGIESAGIYVGGVNGGPEPEPEETGNTLVDNTARGSEYGIWIKNSFGNNVSESLAEDNEEGIAVEVDGLRRLEEEVPGITLAGNTFTDDTSRNNEWDFVADVPLFGPFDSDSTGTLDTDIPVSAFPVTNLNIGSSTKPDTTLSFLSPNVRLRSVRPPVEDDPDGLRNIGRYFEAEGTATEVESIEPEQEELPPLLAVAVSYEGGDVSNVDESTLELRRYNETAGEWQALENPLLDQTDNLVAGITSSTSNFGVFGEPTARKTCIDRRNLGRGQENQECPFDRGIERGESREDVDRNTGRGGGDTHRDSETARRNRGRGEGRSR